MTHYYIDNFGPNIGTVRHGQSAALFRDGELVRAAAEERFTRAKHTIGLYPLNAIRWCIEEEDITLDDVDMLVIADTRGDITNACPGLSATSCSTRRRTLQTVGSIRNTAVQDTFVRALFSEHRIRDGLSGFEYGDLPELRFVDHHVPAASTYYSGFDDANIMVDRSGEYDSTVLWDVVGGRLERTETFKTPNSIGRLYGLVTTFLGYRMNNVDTKIMGMAPYGEPNRQIRDGLNRVVSYGVALMT